MKENKYYWFQNALGIESNKMAYNITKRVCFFNSVTQNNIKPYVELDFCRHRSPTGIHFPLGNANHTKQRIKKKNITKNNSKTNKQ